MSYSPGKFLEIDLKSIFRENLVKFRLVFAKNFKCTLKWYSMSSVGSSFTVFSGFPQNLHQFSRFKLIFSRFNLFISICFYYFFLLLWRDVDSTNLKGEKVIHSTLTALKFEFFAFHILNFKLSRCTFTILHSNLLSQKLEFLPVFGVFFRMVDFHVLRSKLVGIKSFCTMITA